MLMACAACTAKSCGATVPIDDALFGLYVNWSAGPESVWTIASPGAVVDVVVTGVVVPTGTFPPAPPGPPPPGPPGPPMTKIGIPGPLNPPLLPPPSTGVVALAVVDCSVAVIPNWP